MGQLPVAARLDWLSLSLLANDAERIKQARSL